MLGGEFVGQGGKFVEGQVCRGRVVRGELATVGGELTGNLLNYSTPVGVPISGPPCTCTHSLEKSC